MHNNNDVTVKLHNNALFQSLQFHHEKCCLWSTHWCNTLLSGPVNEPKAAGLLISRYVCKCASVWMRVHLTLVRVMLNWMVRMTTRMSKLPSEISVNDLSVYHEMFFNTWNKREGQRNETQTGMRRDLQLSQQVQVMESFSGRSWNVVSVCLTMSTHHLMDGAIEGIVLCKNEKNNEGHVDMMRISFLYVVKDLEDGQHLRGRGGEQDEGLSIWADVVSEMIFIKSLLSVYWGSNTGNPAKQRRLHFSFLGFLFLLITN